MHKFVIRPTMLWPTSDRGVLDACVCVWVIIVDLHVREKTISDLFLVDIWLDRNASTCTQPSFAALHSSCLLIFPAGQCPGSHSAWVVQAFLEHRPAFGAWDMLAKRIWSEVATTSDHSTAAGCTHPEIESNFSTADGHLLCLSYCPASHGDG